MPSLSFATSRIGRICAAWLISMSDLGFLCCSSERLPGFSAVSRGCTDITPWSPGLRGFACKRNEQSSSFACLIAIVCAVSTALRRRTSRTMKPELLLKAMFQAAVDAALPSLCVPAHLPKRPKGRTVVIGAGKASGAMAKALEDAWEGPIEGLVVTRYGYRVPTSRLEVVEAAHPVPDAAGREAARAHPRNGAGIVGRRSRALPDLGRRVGPARAAAGRADARRQAGGEQGAAQIGRDHLRNEHGAEASLRHQRRQARRGRRSRQGGRADDLRRAGRRSLDHRFRPDRAGSVHQRGRARHHREIRHRRAEGRARTPAQSRRDAEARRQAPRRASRTS